MLTGFASPDSQFSFSFATSTYPNGRRFRLRTLLKRERGNPQEYERAYIRDMGEIALVG